MEVFSDRYGFPPTLTPAEAMAWLQAAGLTETDDYRGLSASVRDDPGASGPEASLTANLTARPVDDSQRR
jgi:hypothetical protein